MQTLKDLRWPLVAVSLVVSLSLLFGGAQVARRFTVDQPLRTALSANPAIVSYSVTDTATGKVLTLHLGDLPDLAPVYTGADQAATQVLGAGNYTIALQDRRTAELSEDYHQIHFALQEGIARGTFSQMDTQVQAEAKGLGLSRVRVTVDKDHVFVQLHKGSDYLYDVLPRHTAADKGGLA